MPEPSRKCILVIDDDYLMREAIAESLEYEGYSVQKATNGHDAIAKMSACRPDAIIVDLMMPVMDGWTFLRRRRAEQFFGGLPVLVMSSHRLRAETIKELNVQACIGKPFDLDALTSAVQNLLHEDATFVTDLA